MGIKAAVVSVFANWNNFHSRACRSEFWYFALVWSILFFSLEAVDKSIGMHFSQSSELIESGETIVVTTRVGLLSSMFALLTLIPSLSLTTRRLHDRGFSGWWQLTYGIVIGFIIIPIIAVLPAKEAKNQWGTNPLLEEGAG